MQAFDIGVPLSGSNNISAHRWVDSSYVILYSVDVFSNSYFITRIDKNLEIVYNEEIVGENVNLPINTAINKNSDYIDYDYLYFCGYEGGFIILGEFIWVASLNSDLERRWMNYYGFDSEGNFQIQDIRATRDNGVVLCGDYAGNGHRKGFILKLDADGNVITTSIPEIEDKLIKIKIFPNPSQGNLGLDLDLPKTGPYNLIMRNAAGQSVWSAKNIKSSRVDYSLEFLPNGVYFLQIIQDSKIVFGIQWVKE